MLYNSRYGTSMAKYAIGPSLSQNGSIPLPGGGQGGIPDTYYKDPRFQKPKWLEQMLLLSRKPVRSLQNTERELRIS